MLQSKFDDWISSITDELLREQAKNNSIITGGAIASMLMQQEVNDYDIYFKDKATAVAVAEYYVRQFRPTIKSCDTAPVSIVVEHSTDRVQIMVKSAGIAGEQETERPYRYFEGRPTSEAGAYVGEVMQDPGAIEDKYQDTERAAQATGDDGDKPKYRPVFMSTNAITLSNKIQIVVRFYGEPDQIHDNYDFVHCTNYWSSWDGRLVLRQPALESILSKELRYIGSKYPICSIIRLRKFIARQWTINAGQILKMVMQTNELDLNNFDVLRDQLTGVDCAYFCEVLEKLKEKDLEKINSAYLCEIIDRMF